MNSLQQRLENFSAQDFRERIEYECITGSAIAPELFRTIEVVSSLETRPGGEVSIPIHDALKWRYTRFGYKTQDDLEAALFIQETGETWQAKLSNPRTDQKGKTVKYETPKGNGSRAYLPSIPPQIRQQISQRYGVEVPLFGSFWDWLEQHPELEIVLTEGGKKGLCSLSHGYIAIALVGVYGGCPKVAGVPSLIPDLKRFCANGRKITLAFDQDEKPQTQRKVATALRRLGGLLSQAGSDVSIATWNGRDGKGVDDLIVNCGLSAWEQSYAEALPLIHWQVEQRLLNRLTYPAQQRLNVPDLSEAGLAVPNNGIVAIASAMGTGKTKKIAQTVAGQHSAVNLGHRINLNRNLCSRLGVDYLGDLDKAQGQFISGAGYTLRVGCCVDSLMAIDPSDFAGCDLIIDEVTQVERHLLTSDTCKKDGKRPVLLARFRELMRVARRVIVADADLDDKTLQYLQELRGEDNDIFLVRNDYQPEPYSVDFIESSDPSAIVQHLLEHLGTDPTGATLVCVDSLGRSKAIAETIRQQFPNFPLLLLNSETSGGDLERAFITNPDQHLSRYRVIIASPSLSSGVSIETDGVSAVYGIFSGCSYTPSDMMQALARVRKPVQRVVWCAKRGSNFSKISKSTNALEFKRHLLDRNSATIGMIRASLREDVPSTAERIDYQSDPHLNLYCRLQTDQNWSMYHLRDSLLMHFKHSGHPVQMLQRDRHKAARELLSNAKQAVDLADAQAIFAAADLKLSEALEFEGRDNLTPEQRRSLAKYKLKDFYQLDELTLDDILWDDQGRRRVELLNLEQLLYAGVARDRDVAGLEQQASWGAGIVAWDIGSCELRRWVQQRLGLDDLVQKMIAGWSWTKHDLKPYADRAKANATQVRIALNLTITAQMSDVQIVHQLLSRLGLKFCAKWSRAVEGYEGDKLRVYCLDLEQWGRLEAILERRNSGSPPQENEVNQGGDPTSKQPEPTPSQASNRPLPIIEVEEGRSNPKFWDTPPPTIAS